MDIRIAEIYKVIAFIPLLNQIFDDNIKNGSVKGANNNQVYMSGILNFLAIVSVFLMVRKMYICDIWGVSMQNVLYPKTAFFQE